jgi:peptidoglycan/xylan/chitin deacetylase (PgdA/CDA1 family)
VVQKNVASLTFAFLNFWYFIGKTFLPKLTWRREVTEKVVYLTFDDGPHLTITPWVMAELDKVGAKGTFFMVGDNAAKYPNIVAKLKMANHKVANHTQHHVKGWNMNAADYLLEILACEEAIGKQGLFRPPFGRINFKAIPQIQENMEVIMWDILTKDYLKTLNISRAQKRIRKATRPGSIIVFHDSEKAEKNLKVLLPKYLEFLKEEGYKMETL